MKQVTNFYSKLPFIAQVIFWVVIAILIFYGYKKISAYLKAQKLHSLSGSQVSDNGVTIDLGAKALIIYDAFWDYYGGLAEDETTAINALKSVPTKYVKQLSDIYFSLYTKDLKQDFVKYTDFTQVSNKFI